MRAGDAAASSQAWANDRLWATDRVAQYANRNLKPVEVVFIARYQTALSGRVLEVGCGAGRVLGYLTALGGQVYGIDISPRMVEYCRRAYPDAEVSTGDLRSLGDLVEPPFDAIVAADNILDVLDPASRHRVLCDIRKLLTSEGVLIFSAHNLANIDEIGVAAQPRQFRRMIRALLGRVSRFSLAQAASAALHVYRRAGNQRRLGRSERRAPDYAILNDPEGDYGALHYYVRREDQQRQLHAAGLELIECLDVDGRAITSGSAGHAPWLHYVARPANSQAQAL